MLIEREREGDVSPWICSRGAEMNKPHNRVSCPSLSTDRPAPGARGGIFGGYTRDRKAAGLALVRKRAAAIEKPGMIEPAHRPDACFADHRSNAIC